MLKISNSAKELEHKEQQQPRQETGRKKRESKKKKDNWFRSQKNPLTGILPFQSPLSKK